MLQELSADESHIAFIDNDCGVKKDGFVCSDAYNLSDRTGVHLNRQGLMILSDNLTNAVRQSYFKASLRGEWKLQLK